MSANLPTQAEMFLRALEAVDTARNSLSEARDWLNSDRQPIGTALPGQAGPRRHAALRRIGDAKNTIKSSLSQALDDIDAAGGAR
ncbi:hypothetical protein [Nocardia sp. CC227C]|uniref:hypothetical protein n=1 Tax=Nocardia sp. CC227C TaxID=3044562 RepID=UPI00278BC79C|nr:hypothetical protein [Nocardia sp. CC227C]